MSRAGGTISAIACFCDISGPLRYHGRYPLPDNQRVDELDLKLSRIYHREVRPRLLGVDPGVLNLDLVWQFTAAGLQDVQINGHMKMVSPGDARVSVDEAAAYALATHRHALRRLERISEEHGEELAAVGFSEEELKELIDLKRARYDYLEKNPDCVREVMEVSLTG